MACIKVGLDEWVLIDRTAAANAGVQLNLWTAGLSGCVGIGIIKPPLAFVAHVFSNLSAATWAATYNASVAAAIANLLPFDNTTKIIAVVVGDDNPTPRSNIISGYLDGLIPPANMNLEAEVTVARTGFRMFNSVAGGDWQYTTLSAGGHVAAWGASLNSATGAAHCTNQGFLSPSGAVAEV
ncbi:MAG: hypothetical protein ACJAVM_002122 [Sulfitobacter sp.]|jgi:hypothetical protein